MNEILSLENCETLGAHPEYRALGERLIATGKVACLLFAGGLGTRLKFDGPKGCFPLLGEKTLFEFLFEKILVIQQLFSIKIPVILLLSSFNRELTALFLKQHDYFGLSETQIHFITQKNCSYTDLSGNPLPLEAPNGNGGFYEELYPSSLMETLLSQEVEWLNILPVDNPLATPCDPYFLGYLEQIGANAGIQAVKQRTLNEKAGLLVRENGRTLVRDYTEISMPPPYLGLANMGIYAFRLRFLENLAQQLVSLPLHWIQKQLIYNGEQIAVQKGEKFALDLFSFSSKTGVVLYPREPHFAPLKDAQGEDGVEAVRQALQRSKTVK